MFESTATADTRSRILDAAEQLFAEHGFDGTSIREVTRDAAVNVAAVHYHFGSKEALLRGVTDRVAVPISERRAELLDAVVAAAAPEVPGLEPLLDAFVRADIEVLLELQDRGPRVARFLGRTYSDQTQWIQEMAREQFAGAAASFVPLIARNMPEVGDGEVAWRIGQMTALIVHLFATWPRDGIDAAEAERMLGRLVTFLAAGLRAPAPTDRISPT